MELSGPLFDGLAAKSAGDLCDEIEREVSSKGVDLVQGRLMMVLKKPTPYYWTKIEKIQRRGGTEVTGESVIYHWWLEGKGSRNFPVTRFKGYHTFEIITTQLNNRAEELVAPIIRQYIPRMGGS